MKLIKRISIFVPVISFVIVIIFIFTGSQESYEPKFLLSILNTVFFGILPTIMAVLFFVIYHRTNLLNTLLFGCGILIFSLGATVAGWLRYMPDGANMTVTIHNTSALAASVFHLIGAYNDEQKKPIGNHHNLSKLIVSLLSIFIFITLLTCAVYLKITPRFFEASGPTSLRQMTLRLSIAFFFASAVLFAKLYQKRKLEYYYWYTATLCLYIIGLFSVIFETSVGGIIGWVGRINQYLGGVFALFSILCLVRKTSLQKNKLYQFAKEFFVDAERGYRELVESSCDAIITADQKLNIYFMNKAALDLFEFGTENPVGYSFVDLLYSSSDKHQIAAIMETAHGISDGIREMEAISKKGRVFPVSLSVSTRALHSGLACTFIIRDITLARQAEKQAKEMTEALQKQIGFERMVKSLANDFINIPLKKMDNAITRSLHLLGEYCSADRITIYRYDWEKDRVCLQNEWASDDKYRQDDAYKNIPISSVIPETIEKHKKGIPFIGYGVNDTAESVAPNHAGIYLSVPLMVNDKTIGYCLLCKINDTSMWSESSLSIIYLFCEMFTNVCQRVQYENTILDRNETMSLMLNATNDGIGMLNREGKILSVNAQLASRFGKEPNEITDTCFRELLPYSKYKDLYEQRLARIQSVFESNQPVQFEDSRDGMWFSNRVYPVHKEDSVIAAALFSTDITDHIKALEEEKKIAEYKTKLRIQTEFFTNLSHEFKTPITLILLQLELMKSYHSENGKWNECLHTLMQNAYRLAKLVGNLLDISKLDAGYLTADLRYMDIVSLIQDITHSIRDFAKTKSIDVRFETKLLGYHMAVDKDKTERIILNLLSNAIKYSQSGGSVCVTVKGKEDGVLIIVTDTGIGIPKDKQALIFDRFAQVDTSLSRKAEGSGIGLSLTKSLVVLLKGKIWVESRPGKGSRFFVELPTQEIDKNKVMPEVYEHDLTQRIKMEFADIY